MSKTRVAGRASLRVSDNEIWLDAMLNHEWRLSYRIRVQKGRIVIAELRVFPRPRRLKDVQAMSGTMVSKGHARIAWRAVDMVAEQRMGLDVPLGGLSSRLLRQVRLGHDVHSFAEILEDVKTRYPAELLPDGALGRQGITTETLLIPPKMNVTGRGRPALSPAKYAGVASLYAKAVARGSHRPVEEVAKKLGEKSIGKIRSRIRKARDLGLLERGRQGNAGGKLTPAGKALLRKGARDGKATRTR